ncbi:MAG: hypothetical protein AAF826_11040 [Pseudomonadota bacterium]
MDLFLKIFDRIGTLLALIQNGRIHAAVRAEMRALLYDPAHTQRKFTTLLTKAGVYDNKPNDLRRILMLMGARRYSRRSDGEELWGIPGRDNKPDDAVQPQDPHPFAAQGATFLGVLSFILVIGFWNLPEILSLFQVDGDACREAALTPTEFAACPD